MNDLRWLFIDNRMRPVLGSLPATSGNRPRRVPGGGREQLRGPFPSLLDVTWLSCQHCFNWLRWFRSVFWPHLAHSCISHWLCQLCASPLVLGGIHAHAIHYYSLRICMHASANLMGTAASAKCNACFWSLQSHESVSGCWWMSAFCENLQQHELCELVCKSNPHITWFRVSKYARPSVKREAWEAGSLSGCSGKPRTWAALAKGLGNRWVGLENTWFGLRQDCAVLGKYWV